MESFNPIKKTNRATQQVALHSSKAISVALKSIKTSYPQITIEKTKESIKIPKAALQLLAQVLDSMGKGQPVTIIPITTELTTQAAAEYLGCSRPHLVKLLERGEIPFTKVGKHRRVRFQDIQKYRDTAKANQKAALKAMMKADEESGLYDP